MTVPCRIRDIHPRRPTPPDQIAKAMTGRDYISYSQITAFQACPLKWRFAYVENAPRERLSAAMLVGTSVHAAIQRLMEAHAAAEPRPNIDNLMVGYREAWQKEAALGPVHFAREDTAESLEQIARQMVETFMASPFGRPTGEVLGIEELLRIRLADDLPDLAARVDMIELRQGELIVTDYKTARSMWSAEAANEHAQQLLLYGQAAAAVARELDAKVRLQFVVLTKAKSPKVEAIPVENSLDRVGRCVAVARQVFRAMQSDQHYPVPSAFNCTGCSFSQRCERWHRATAGAICRSRDSQC